MSETHLAQAAQAVNAVSHVRSTPQMWGRHVSASIDFWSFLLLPTLFLVYICLEFSGFLVEVLGDKV